MTIKALKPYSVSSQPCNSLSEVSPGLHDHQGIETSTELCGSCGAKSPSPGLHDRQGIETLVLGDHVCGFHEVPGTA